MGKAGQKGEMNEGRKKEGRKGKTVGENVGRGEKWDERGRKDVGRKEAERSEEVRKGGRK